MKKAERLRRDLKSARTKIIEASNTGNEYQKGKLAEAHGIIEKVRAELTYGIKCESCARY